MACRAATSRALIMARGLGRRMRAGGADASLDPAQQAVADAGVKAMMPFGRPFLDYVLHALAEAGVREVGIVLGPEHDVVRRYYRGIRTHRLVIAFVLQPEADGTAGAIACAESWAGDEPFLALNADNLYPGEVLARLVAGREPALPGFERDSLQIPLARIGAFALLECDARGRLVRIVEKPGEPAVREAGPSALISMNAWRFDSRIFGACRDVTVSRRGERELPHAVALAVTRGVAFEVLPARGPVLDLSSREDVGPVARALKGYEVAL